MLNEHTEKCVADSKEIPAASLVSGGLGKYAPTSQLDAQARADMYSFLSAVYLRPPTPDLVRYLLAEDLLWELYSLFGEESVTELKQFAASGYLDSDFASIDLEYINLFAAPTSRYVTPYEDVYRGIAVGGMLQRGPLFGEQAIATRREYREAGADMDRACMELPSHIGVELSFMSFLCEREAKAICDEEEQKLPTDVKRTAAGPIRYRELQIKFLTQHLNAWFPQLNRSIQANAKSPFYRWMAQITASFLAYDTNGLLDRS